MKAAREYHIGDMLKTKCNNGYAYCIITEYCSYNAVKVFWIVERGYVKNVPVYANWSFSILDTEFERLS